MYKVSVLDKISFILVIIGGINWGLYGLFNFDIVHLLLGFNLQIVSRIIYILLGIAGVDMLIFILKTRKAWYWKKKIKGWFKPFIFYSSNESINFTISSTAKLSSSPDAITLTVEFFVTPNDKTPIRLFTLAFLPLNSILTSDLKEDAFFTNKVAGLACRPVAFLTTTSLVTTSYHLYYIIITNIYIIAFFKKITTETVYFNSIISNVSPDLQAL